MNKDILIVDDEEDIRHLIAGILQDDGFSTRLAWDYTSIKKEISKRIPSLILLDVWLENSDLDGIQILKLLKKSYPNIPIIMISGHGTIKMAISSLQVGAFNFIEKPFDTSLLVLNIKRAIEDAELKIKLSQFIDDDTIFIGKSNPALLVKSLIEKVAATKSRVFITGPTGSGKKHIAKLIHNKSSRALGAIVFLNTKRLIPDAIEEELFGKENVEGNPERIGLVEQAHNGTLYIDEAANLCTKSQRRLIKLLTENRFLRVNGKYAVEVDIRIIAASSKNIHDMVINKNFSEDLFYRLNVVPIIVPSLKERIEDIPEFINYFLKKCSKTLGVANKSLSKDHYNLLQSINLSGNLRQLKNIIEHLLIVSQTHSNDEITKLIMSYNNKEENNFSDIIQKKMISLSLKKARELFETEYINLQMKRFNNNVSKTADFIGMERSALHRKLKILNEKGEN
ncbi:MAG: sigma-54-dependent Fis family transcriptional regulator [Pelagibacterales bacterium]|nr:sigma-54-dependent Fis family transcriptional regulator [Pelagibacterales bacterium]